MRLIVRSVFAAVALALLVVARAPAQEPVTITGKVTSDGGLPLGQVEIAIPVMGIGALSKDDGSYPIVVPGARVSGQTVMLVARRLGYKPQSAQITLTAGGVTHDFVLAANPLQLGEVVVTGAGTTTSTEKLGNVRNSVGADLIAKAGEANMRSEEHTSELQSRLHLVCRLLLEKKKKIRDRSRHSRPRTQTCGDLV